jgi:putative ABC transport system permease protein
VDGTVVRALLAVVVLIAIAVLVSWRASLGHGRDLVIVTVRAIVQLILVAGVIKVVFTTPAWAPIYLAAMLVAATWTSGRRLHRRGVPRVWLPCAIAIAAGAAVPALVVVLTGALPLAVNQLVPFTAQIIGGAMTATTLASLRMLDDVTTGWTEVEGWLALGARGAIAVRQQAGQAARAALVPALDQTRNVGLVVLPGAYVGLLLAGATPLDAGRVQLLVLVSLLAAEVIAATLVTRLLSEALGDQQHPQLR